MIEKYQRLINELVIVIKNSDVYSIKKSEIIRRTVRLFGKGKIAIAASKGNVGFATIIKEVEKNIKYGQCYNYNMPDNSVVHHYFTVKKQVSSDKEFIKFVSILFEKIRSKFPDYIFLNSIKRSIIEKNINIRDKSDLLIKYHIINFTILFKHKNSKNIFDGILPYIKTDLFDVDVYIDKIGEIIKALNNPSSLNKFDFPIALMNINNTFIGKKIRDYIVGENYHKGSSILSGTQSKRIFNENINMFDVSYYPEKAVFNIFDDELFIRENYYLPIIENGILRNLLYDRRTANIYKQDPTGNGIKPEYNKFPQTSANALLFRVNDQDEIPKRAIVPFIFYEGNIDSNGIFSAPCPLAFLMEDGKFTSVLPQLYITGNIFELFGENFIGMGNKYFADSHINPFIYSRVNITKLH